MSSKGWFDVLCLITKHPLKRRSLKEKLHLSKKEKAEYTLYSTSYGELCIYSVYSFSDVNKTAQKLINTVKERVYTCDSPVFEEYLIKKNASELIKQLKRKKNKTVCINAPYLDQEELEDICAYSRAVYIVGSLLPDCAENIYKKTGVMPTLVGFPKTADFILDTKNIPYVNLPQELSSICPPEFSPLLFASLIYKENGRFI